MPIHVICSGCLKRFQVGARFAGMQGPCPNCGAMISIPKESVKLHGIDETVTKHKKHHRVPSRVIPRRNLEFDPIQVRYFALCVLGVLLLAFILGCVPMSLFVRSLLGTLGLCFAAFPLTLFGYHVLRDREQIFAFTGKELYRRTGFAAAGYVIFWIGFEYFLTATHADGVVAWIYLAAFAVLATILVHLLLVMKTSDAFLHCTLFGFSVVILRFLLGLGWFWEPSGWIRYSAVPPPPILLGM